jgi:hypothetical protein
MSDDLISHNEDLARLVADGFQLSIHKEAYLIVENVPYVDPLVQLRRGKFICSITASADSMKFSPTDHTMWLIGKTPCNSKGEPLSQIINHSTRTNIVDDIWGDHYFSSYPEGTGGKYADFYEKVVAYERLLARHARRLDPSANARSNGRLIAAAGDTVFRIPDTFSGRYGIDPLKAHFQHQKVAIIGLGGTGSYVLDLISKCAVKSIDLFDGDQLLNHNLFRSPGVPTEDETAQFPSKVDYYAQIYGRMHRSINPHNEFIDGSNTEALRGFDFCFICVDRGDSRELVTTALVTMGIPFVDTGIGVGLVDNALDGVVRVTAVLDGNRDFATAKKFLHFNPPDDNDPYDKNIQIADLNSLNAALAVLRWKRWSGFFRDSRAELNSRYMIEGNMLANRPRSAD